MKKASITIGKHLATHLPEFTLQSSKSRFSRKSDSGWQAIVFDVLPTAIAGVVKFAAHAQIRLDAIESIYLPLHPFITAESAVLHPTLVTNCDSLLRDRSLAHGFRLDTISLQEFALRYAEEIHGRIIPWLNQYSTEEGMLGGLIDKDPMKWATSDRLTRYPVLMAILARRGDHIRFDAIKAEFDLYCEQRHAICYQPLAAAMAKIRIQNQP